MLKKNSFLFGISIGAILPGLVFFCEEVLKKDLRIYGKENVLYILAFAVNFFMIRYYFKSDIEDTGRGVVMATFLSAFAFFYFKAQQ